MYTQAEAKEKWCPFVRALMDNVGANRTDNDEPIGECIASRCAAWRWDSKNPKRFLYAADNKATVEPKRSDDIPKNWVFVAYRVFDEAEGNWAMWAETDEAFAARHKKLLGFCGLAGKP